MTLRSMILTSIISLPILYISTVKSAPFTSAFVIKENNKIEVLDSELIEGDKSFTFNWHDTMDLKDIKNKIPQIETLVKKKPPTELSALDIESRGRLLYKLGAYYAHIKGDSNLAIAKSHLAEGLLKSKSDKSWNYNNLAYAYEKRFATRLKAADKREALFYANKVITTNANAANEEVAFAYCIKYQISKDERNLLNPNYQTFASQEAERQHHSFENYIKLQNFAAMFQNATDKSIGDINLNLLTIVDNINTENFTNAYCDTEMISEGRLINSL